MSDDVEWSSVESFGIDGNELDGLRPQEIFTLGVEWQLVASEANAPQAFSRPIRCANRDRIEAILKRRGRQYRLTFMPEDASESYLWLEVTGDAPETIEHDPAG